MLPNNESLVYHMAQTLASNLMNNQLGYAYPQLVPVLQVLGMDIQNVFSNLLGHQRAELFFGESPWAKLYELQTGKKIAVPDKAIIKHLTNDRMVSCGKIPMGAILDYFLKYRDYEDDEMVFFIDGDHENQVCLDLKTKKAKYYWRDNDMRLELTDFAQSRGYLSCPLFHEPYDVDVDYAYIERTLLDPLYARIIGDKWPIEQSGENILHQHYFGSMADPKKVADESNVRQLMVLLDGGMYSRHAQSYVYWDWKEYRLQFSVRRDWNYAPPQAFQMSISTYPENNNGQPRTVYDWWKNPLLVSDLLNDMDSILDDIITEHELSMRGEIS